MRGVTINMGTRQRDADTARGRIVSLEGIVSNVQVLQDPGSFLWEVSDAATGVRWSFIDEADARDAAVTLATMIRADVLLPMAGMDLEAQAVAID